MESSKLNRDEAMKLLHQHMQNVNLRRHCYAVGYAMAGIYDYLNDVGKITNKEIDRETWEVLGIIHDSDYELTKDDWSQHTLLLLNWLKDYGYEENDLLYKAVQSHNCKYTNLRCPETQMEWALECCDELTGFIVACALVTPEKKLTSVEISSVLKKWKQPAFARAVKREQIEQCEEKLGIKLEDFIGVVLNSMKLNSEILGL